MKGAAIGTDFDFEVIRPGDAHFGAAGPAGLKQQAARVSGLILIDFQLMPAGRGVGQQCCIGRHRQSIRQISGCVDAKLIQLLNLRSGGFGPLALRKDQQGQRVLIPCDPTVLR